MQKPDLHEMRLKHKSEDLHKTEKHTFSLHKHIPQLVW